MEYVGGTNQYLMTIHSLEHSGRVTLTARRVLQCFRVVDVGYFVTGLALTVSSADADIQNIDTILFGSILLVFSFLSAICNALALHGVNKEIRRYLLPWLILYPWVIVLLVVAVIHKMVDLVDQVAVVLKVTTMMMRDALTMMVMVMVVLMMVM